MPLILFILFLVIPILEIAAFIQIGSLIGLFPTLASIVLTAVAGAYLVRRQGLQTLNDARLSSANGELPVGPLFHGVFILIAGLLLLTPGFVTDAAGFLLLIPPLRRLIGARIWEKLKDNVEIQQTNRPYPGDGNPYKNDDSSPVIDGDAVDITESNGKNSKSNTESPWKEINHTDR